MQAVHNAPCAEILPRPIRRSVRRAAISSCTRGRAGPAGPAPIPRQADAAVGGSQDAALRPVDPVLRSRTLTVCGVCRKSGYWIRYCPRCQRLVNRPTDCSRPQRVAALVNGYDAGTDGFLCYYTGVPLDEHDNTDPFHLWYDLRVPDDPATAVLSSMLANRMKTDMSEEEFRIFVPQLDDGLHGGRFDKNAVKFRYWKRHGRRR